jgi:hypothetical protein
LGEAEVQQPNLDLRPVGHEDVRRLHVAMDDPVRMRMAQALENLRADLDRARVGEIAAADAVTQRLARNVLVGDVDVPFVAVERVGAEAPRVAQPCSRLGLAFSAGASLAFARDDLQRDVETIGLIAREPDRARAAAPERPQGPVPAEDELTGRKRRDRCRHVRFGLGTAG